MSILGVGLQNVIISVGISAIPSFIRLVRSSVLSIREQVFVEAARALGQRAWIIILSRPLPISAWAHHRAGHAQPGERHLRRRWPRLPRLGVQPPTPEWGTMLGEGRQYIFRAPSITLFPGLAIFLAVLGFNLLGDGLRDALDPRMQQV